MRIKLLAAFLFLAFISCSKEKDAEDLSGQKFVHHLFPDQAACEAFLASGGQNNCYEYLKFLDKGQAEILSDDIILRGQYEVENNQVRLFFHTMDLVNYFPIQWEYRDQNTLVATNSQVEWKRVKGPSDWDLY